MDGFRHPLAGQNWTSRHGVCVRGQWLLLFSIIGNFATLIGEPPFIEPPTEYVLDTFMIGCLDSPVSWLTWLWSQSFGV